MISNNINFKCQLKQFGGYGYADLFKRYLINIQKNCNLNDEELKMIFRDNLLNLITWWEPPKISQKVVKNITCEL
jgi:hypothetical protein